MVSISKLIAGLVFIFGGIVLTIVGFFSALIFLIYSLPMIVLGIWLLVDKSEDKIEERKDIKVARDKK